MVTMREKASNQDFLTNSILFVTLLGLAILNADRIALLARADEVIEWDLSAASSPSVLLGLTGSIFGWPDQKAGPVAVPTSDRIRRGRRSAMADKHIIIGRVINLTGMIGVSAGIVLLAFGIVSLVFRRGFGFDIANPFHWFW
jgi:hypothetical protein